LYFTALADTLLPLLLLLPPFLARLRETYMYHMLGQMLFFLAWGGLPYFVWGFVVRVLLTMHMTW
jgi:stearoyl-CoA desaturase (delta-9 desaturase)